MYEFYSLLYQRTCKYSNHLLSPLEVGNDMSDCTSVGLQRTSLLLNQVSFYLYSVMKCFVYIRDHSEQDGDIIFN
jgi:hypothetical protein